MNSIKNIIIALIIITCIMTAITVASVSASSDTLDPKITITEIMFNPQGSTEYGMQTFDQALFTLFENDEITYEDALRNADSINDLRLRIKLQGKTAKASNLMDEVGGMQMQQDEKEAPGRMR